MKIFNNWIWNFHHSPQNKVDPNYEPEIVEIQDISNWQGERVVLTVTELLGGGVVSVFVFVLSFTDFIELLFSVRFPVITSFKAVTQSRDPGPSQELHVAPAPSPLTPENQWTHVAELSLES